MTTLIPKYDQGSTGAVNRPINLKLAEWVSVKDFGAVGDGTTDDTAAIQAALDAIVASGKPNTLIIPTGTYKCTSGITMDVSYVNLVGLSATLNFSTMLAGVCFTVGATALNAFAQYYNGKNGITGLAFQGTGSPAGGLAGTAIGVRYYSAAEPGPAQSFMRNCLIDGFYIGLSIEDNSYILNYEQVNFAFNSTCVHLPAVTNGGERICFSHCLLSNSDYGFIMSNGIGQLLISQCSIGGMFNAFIAQYEGIISVMQCNLEGNFTGDNSGAHIYVRQAAGNGSSSVAFTDCNFLVKGSGGTARGNPAFEILGSGLFNFTIRGGTMNVTAITGPALITSSYPIVATLDNIQYSDAAALYSFAADTYLYYRNYRNTLSPNIIGTPNEVTVTALATPTALGSNSASVASGLYLFTDITSGGSALFLCDNGTGVATSISNSITGLSCVAVAGSWGVSLASGTVPRRITWLILAGH